MQSIITSCFAFLMIIADCQIQSSSKDRYEIYPSNMSIPQNSWVKGVDYYHYWNRKFAGWYDKIIWLQPLTSDLIRLDYTIEIRDKDCKYFSCYEHFLDGAVDFCSDTSCKTQSASVLYIVRKLLGRLEDCPIQPGTVDVSYLSSTLTSNIYWDFDPMDKVIRIIFNVRDKKPGTYPDSKLAMGYLYVDKVD